jgi:undecaprenyl-diphosphatase
MLLAGLAQVFGLLPGVSRSGITLAGGQLGGLSFKKAKEFAFLLFIPIMFGSIVFSINDGFMPTTIPVYALILSTLVSMVVTWLSLKFVLHTLKLHHLPYFSVYLIVLGLVTLFVAFL